MSGGGKSAPHREPFDLLGCLDEIATWLLSMIALVALAVVVAAWLD